MQYAMYVFFTRGLNVLWDLYYNGNDPKKYQYPSIPVSYGTRLNCGNDNWVEWLLTPRESDAQSATVGSEFHRVHVV